MHDSSKYCGSEYLREVLDVNHLAVTVQTAVANLSGTEFDAIAFRGMSGALVAPAVAVRMNKGLILVRKPNDGSHSAFAVEGDHGAKTYIIIDDFMSTGATARAIVEGVKNFAPDAVCLGVYQVDPNRSKELVPVYKASPY